MNAYVTGAAPPLLSPILTLPKKKTRLVVKMAPLYRFNRFFSGLVPLDCSDHMMIVVVEKNADYPLWELKSLNQGVVIEPDYAPI